VLPPSYATAPHHHERQQELYLVMSGEVELEFGDGEKRRLGPGGLARVDAPTVRSVRNTSAEHEAVYVCVGGADGYVGRDGVVP
jgi:quercetin dioxygenase-like cupin family protein